VAISGPKGFGNVKERLPRLLRRLAMTKRERPRNDKRPVIARSEATWQSLVPRNHTNENGAPPKERLPRLLRRLAMTKRERPRNDESWGDASPHGS